MPKAISTHELGDAMNRPDAPQVIDVRRQSVFDASERMITGAAWRNPEEIETWLFGQDDPLLRRQDSFDEQRSGQSGRR